MLGLKAIAIFGRVGDVLLRAPAICQIVAIVSRDENTLENRLTSTAGMHTVLAQ